MKLFILCTALSLGMLMPFTGALAQTGKSATVVDEDDMIPDVKESVTYEYHCEMKDFLTIYTNADDNEHLALRWKNRIYRMKRVVTTTGANRFENKKAGLVWIGIPTKGMLLDSRHGMQLANECKTAGQ